MDKKELASVARALVARGKGILAADESSGTIKKRLASIDLESTEENRQVYRDLLFTSPGVEEYISGVILFDETIRQQALDGRPFPRVLAGRGIMPGIKVDKGTVPLPGAPAEKLTEGLDGLRARLEEYRGLGARFTKWRAVITIGDGIPSRNCIDANAQALALYAAYCQEADLVPIVEPEVLMDGDHSIERCAAVTRATLESVFQHLSRAGVLLEGMLLKPNMVISGKGNERQAGVQEVAEATVRTLLRAVPAAVPGIVFLSGGQSPEQATEHLSAMNRLGRFPWELSFSYGRALQENSLKAWRGEPRNVPQAQQIFAERSRLNSLARSGEYSREMETAR
ncbi:MAG: fructose-bisphosphate aldolase class I [Anaerolineae bacterium]|jgi:fructose-bisphosphate aldolase class I|nr:fructose-bisphosphate aldolase class I [Anaerolineae bacterium]MDX9831501.1 class I fructose-bisphosphate aldolase [Anaerolineae bacterium]